MRLALQEQRMGASLTDSLSHVRERVDSPNLNAFVRAVVQGERLGVSIGQVMRDLAIDMRKRRRQMAEEQAQKAPVKMLIPLVFLILPTIFIVVLVPPILGDGDALTRAGAVRTTVEAQRRT
jgi:tight adherence protein C